MSEETIIEPKSESTSHTPTQPNQNVTLTCSHLVILFALGLGISFFLPWARFLGATVSGFDLQKLGDEQRLLWLIPFFSVIAVVAGLTNKSQQLAGQLAGVLPLGVAVYWFSKVGQDLTQILDYGAYLSLVCGAGLLVVSRKLK